MRTQSLYHRTLRVSSVIVAFTLLFSSDLLGTRDLATSTGRFAANVIGVGASVAPTELNTITAELTRRSQELDLREQAVYEREIDAQVGDSSDEIPLREYVLSGVLLLLLCLIVLNYVLDFMRARAQQRTYGAMG